MLICVDGIAEITKGNGFERGTEKGRSGDERRSRLISYGGAAQGSGL